PSTDSTLSLHDALPICQFFNCADAERMDLGRARLDRIDQWLEVIGHEAENQIQVASREGYNCCWRRWRTMPKFIYRFVVILNVRSEEHTSELQSPDHLV